MADRPDINLASVMHKYRMWLAAGIAAVLLAVIMWGADDKKPVRTIPESSAVDTAATSPETAPEGPGTAEELASSSEVSSPAATVPSGGDEGAEPGEAAESEGADETADIGRLAKLPGRSDVPADDPRTHSITVLRGLNKITAEITELDLPAGAPVQFGSLTITAKACWSRPPEEQPETYAFLEIDDNTVAGDDKRIFSGWMMASSPALNSLEHPIYDVWVINCKTTEPEASSGSE